MNIPSILFFCLNALPHGLSHNRRRKPGDMNESESCGSQRYGISLGDRRKKTRNYKNHPRPHFWRMLWSFGEEREHQEQLRENERGLLVWYMRSSCTFFKRCQHAAKLLFNHFSFWTVSSDCSFMLGQATGQSNFTGVAHRVIFLLLETRPNLWSGWSLKTPFRAPSSISLMCNPDGWGPTPLTPPWPPTRSRCTCSTPFLLSPSRQSSLSCFIWFAKNWLDWQGSSVND